MTVSSTTTRNSYAGDGSTTAFSYTFKIFDEDDIAVILRDNATATETVQTITLPINRQRPHSRPKSIQCVY